jgi:hypothetical protein
MPSSSLWWWWRIPPLPLGLWGMQPCGHGVHIAETAYEEPLRLVTRTCTVGLARVVALVGVFLMQTCSFAKILQQENFHLVSSCLSFELLYTKQPVKSRNLWLIIMIVMSRHLVGSAGYGYTVNSVSISSPVLQGYSGGTWCNAMHLFSLSFHQPLISVSSQNFIKGGGGAGGKLGLHFKFILLALHTLVVTISWHAYSALHHNVPKSGIFTLKIIIII